MLARHGVGEDGCGPADADRRSVADRLPARAGRGPARPGTSTTSVCRQTYAAKTRTRQVLAICWDRRWRSGRPRAGRHAAPPPRTGRLDAARARSGPAPAAPWDRRPVPGWPVAGVPTRLVAWLVETWGSWLRCGDWSHDHLGDHLWPAPSCSSYLAGLGGRARGCVCCSARAPSTAGGQAGRAADTAAGRGRQRRPQRAESAPAGLRRRPWSRGRRASDSSPPEDSRRSSLGRRPMAGDTTESGAGLARFGVAGARVHWLAGAQRPLRHAHPALRAGAGAAAGAGRPSTRE